MEWGKADWMKLIFVSITFVEAFICGLVPIYTKKFNENPKILGIASTFSAGLFIAISLLHILPE